MCFLIQIAITRQCLEPKPISSIDQFASSALQYCHQLTSPTVLGVDGFSITDDQFPGCGFGIIYIPESDLPPHRVVLNMQGVKDLYFVRSGSSFVCATHSQLEDMFGRRPRPRLNVALSIKNFDREIVLKVSVGNIGRGFAEHPYVELTVEKPFYIARFGLEGDGITGMALFNSKECSFGDIGYRHFGSTSFVPKTGQVLHSGMELDLTVIRGACGPGDPGLSLTVKIASEGSPLTTNSYFVPKPRLRIDGNIDLMEFNT
jgi:hypothetical protein